MPTQIAGYHVPPAGVTSSTSVPGVLSLGLSTPYKIASLSIYALVVCPVVTVYATARHLLAGPPRTAPSWSLGKHVKSYLLCALMHVVTWPVITQDSEKAIATIPGGSTPKGMKATTCVVPPMSEQDRIGWAVQKQVKCEPVPAFMVERVEGAKGLARASKGEKVVLYFIGGAYVAGHPLQAFTTAWTTSKMLGVRVFAPNYRKSLAADTAFPACLLDAVAAWQYLLDMGFEAKNIVLQGDSAGGNLCLALARYLADLKRERGKDLGQPGGMLLFSPWVDLTFAGKGSIIANRASDWVGPLGGHGVPRHLRHFPQSAASPFFSPALASPNGSPRFAHLADTHVYIQTGTAELLYDEDKALAEGMRQEGIKVRCRDLKDGWHIGLALREEVAVKAAEKDLPEFWREI